MNPRHPASVYSLPVLLSFNELAWILIFGIGLVSAHTWWQAQNREAEPPGAGEKTNGLARTSADVGSGLASTGATNGLPKADVELLRQLAALKHTNAQLVASVAEVRRQLALEEAARQTGKNEAANLREASGILAKRLNESGEALRRKDEELVLALARSVDLEKELRGLRGSVSPRLLGLGGKLQNVAILLDRSGSMGTKGPGQGGSRWASALAVINNWLYFLPVERCVLITFNDRCTVYPENGFISVAGNEGRTNRLELMRQLQDLEPEGNTDTLSALQAAYNLDGTNKVDTIILFTDGAPYLPAQASASASSVEGGGRNAFSRRLMKDVLALSARHRDVPVNTVAIGDYYMRREFTTFLMELSGGTGGAFLGK